MKKYKHFLGNSLWGTLCYQLKKMIENFIIKKIKE